jgi:hypothetical protein
MSSAADVKNHEELDRLVEAGLVVAVRERVDEDSGALIC